MCDLLSPLEWIGIFFSIHLMSVHDPAKSQQYSVIFAKSAADTKNRLFFRDRALFMADTVLKYLEHVFWDQEKFLMCQRSLDTVPFTYNTPLFLPARNVRLLFCLIPLSLNGC
jgi:hypothetical protein